MDKKRMSASVVKASVRPILKIVTPTNNPVINPVRPILKIVTPEENSISKPVLKIVEAQNKSKKRIRKYTLSIFLERAKEIHGDKIDYSKVKEKDIDEGSRSRISLTCRKCNYEWSTTILIHINGKSDCPNCAGKVKWNLDKLLKKGKEIHGDKINYSRVNEKNINGKDSKIDLICNICKYEWEMTIHSHINGKHGCKNCSGQVPWDLKRFLEKAKEIHGDKIDYSRVKSEDINNGSKSIINLICNICSYQWSPVLSDHINSKSGCPDCAGTIKWNLPRFLEKAKEIHGNNIDYSSVFEENIEGGRSKINLRCNICQYEWSPEINSHINVKSGCPNCAGKVPLTLPRFLEKVKQIYGNNIDYSSVTEENITNKNFNKIKIKCNVCQYQWSLEIRYHLYNKTSCPNCTGIIPLTLNKFLEKGKEIHGDKIDYSQVKENNIEKGKLDLKCNICQYIWSTSINSHIGRKTGCPNCAGNAPWTFERFIKKAKEIHGDKIDYSQVKSEDIKGGKSLLNLKCNICRHEWMKTINSHINNKTGCFKCLGKGYSKVAINWLKSIEEEEDIVIQCATSPEGEYKIPSPNGGYYRLDGFCHETQVAYEFQGDYWHGNPRRYDPCKMNKTVGKTFGELYRKTIEKEEYIRSLGYKLVVKWETPVDDTDQ